MKEIRYGILASTLLILSIACYNASETDTYEDQDLSGSVVDSIPYRDLRDFPAVASETNIDSLIAEMKKGDCVHERAIGWGGWYCREFACFGRLTELLNDEETFELTKHANPKDRLA